MRLTLDLVPERWLDYEPPGLCQIAAAPALGALASIGGTVMSIIGQNQQSAYQEAVARNQAVALRQKANEDAAIGQRQAITESRKADLVQSRARALGAASGTAVSSPTQVAIESGIASQGEHNAMSALYEGMSRSQADTYQADLQLFKADQVASAAPLQTISTLFSGASGLARGASGLGWFDNATAADDGTATPRRRRSGPGLSLLDLLE